MSKEGKQDEFYTQLSLVENEMKHYVQHFKGKTIFCNCDDPEESNFWKYFELNFDRLGLKKLVSTHYEKEIPSYKLEITGDVNGDGITDKHDIVRTRLVQNGDFRSQECIDIMNSADIIITNPPFSLFREYVSQLIDNNKKFIIIGNQNAITYKEIFRLFQENKIWMGYNSGHFWFRVPDNYEVKTTDFKIDDKGVKWRRMGNICYFTNLDIDKRHESMLLYKNYDEAYYPKYDGYDIIEVSKTLEIPCDYYGVMGVPITFMERYNPDQFEILGVANSARYIGLECKTLINGKKIYNRVLIKRKEASR